MLRKSFIAFASLGLVQLGLVHMNASASPTTDSHLVVTKPAPSASFTRAPLRDAGLVKIFDDMLPLRKYPKGTYACCVGTAISSPASVFGQYWFAVAFTPTFDATATRVEIGASFDGGADNKLEIGLYSDAGGLPGDMLITKTVTDLPTFGSCCEIAIAKDKEGVGLKAGSQYWVVVTTSNDAHTVATWNENTPNQVDIPPGAYNNGSGWTATGGGPAMPSFAVLGHL